ncbi:MAG: hypothetical protein ACLQPH_21490 [Acidimicrobiales bacterium]
MPGTEPIPVPSPDAAQVVVEPPDEGPGYWAGGPSAVLSDDGTFWLAYRLRRPLGTGRGYANVVARSADGVTFETVVVLDRESFDCASLERPALVALPDGSWRLYVSCATPGTDHWRVEGWWRSVVLWAEPRWPTRRALAARPNHAAAVRVTGRSDPRPGLLLRDGGTRTIRDPPPYVSQYRQSLRSSQPVIASGPDLDLRPEVPSCCGTHEVRDRRRRPAAPQRPAMSRAANGRQPKQGRAELRELMVETGRAILRDEGLGAGAEALTFKRVFARVERDTGVRLTNASIIRRVWENQADFQSDVLAGIAADGSDTEIRRTVDALSDVLATMDVSSEAGRRQALRDICRVAGQASRSAYRESPDWPTWMGVWALAAGGAPFECRRRIQSALVEGYESFVRRYEGVYREMADVLGLRLRPGLTFRHLAVAAESLGQGCELRYRIDPSEMESIRRPTRPGGGEEEWVLFAIGLEALVLQFLEFDPDWEPSSASR